MIITRLFFIFFISLQTIFNFGQNIKTLSINSQEARKINLSEIAEKVTPIALEKPTGGIQYVLPTNEYLFVVSISNIIQFDLSGKYIRTINCGGYPDNAASNEIKKELYVCVGDKIKCYDYSGNLKKEYSLNAGCLYCLYHKEALWIQTYNFRDDHKGTNYTIKKIDPDTGKIITLPYEWEVEAQQTENGSPICMTAASYLTLYENNVMASFEFNTIVYKIQQNKVIPYVQWNISPPAQSHVDKVPLQANGFVGDCLFINYRRSDRFYVYLENMKTGKKYNVDYLADDIYQTKENCELRPVNQKDYFYFIKNKNEIKGNNIGDVPVKDGPVLFLVKLK